MPYSDSDRIGRHARLDPLLLTGGFVLASVAGFINTSALTAFQIPVSHMSGVVSKLGIDLAAHDYGDMPRLASIFTGFLAGATASGFIIGSRDFHRKPGYSLVLTLEAATLLLAALVFPSHAVAGMFGVAFACGLQNAMASSYLGLIIRTTHVTGIVTDLGALLGQAAKTGRLKKWKAGTLTCLLAGFFLGGMAGLIAFRHLHYLALLLPSAVCLSAALLFYILRIRGKKPGSRGVR